MQFAFGSVCSGCGDRALRSYVTCFVASKLTKKIKTTNKQNTKQQKKLHQTAIRMQKCCHLE